MTPEDKPEFARILIAMASIKPGGKITAEALELHWSCLQDWPLNEFKSAAAHLAKSEEFMPNPFHFERLRKQSQLTAGEAWTSVRAVLRTLNRYERTTISPRIDRVVAAMGGYVALSQSDSDEMHFREKRFAELWEELGDAEEVRVALPFLEPQRQVSGPRPVMALLKR